MIESLRISVIRTIVPLVVGLIVSGAARIGLGIDEGIVSQLVTVVVTTLYYACVRLLEERVGPAWGWLVGYARVPRYSDRDREV